MLKLMGDTYAEYRNLPRPVWALAGARLINAAGAYVYPFLTLLLIDHAGFNEEQTGRILMIAMTMVVPGSLIGGVVADRIGRKRLLLTAQLMAALSIGIIGFIPLDETMIWFILVEGFFSGLMMPASRAATFDLTDAGNRKAAFSLLYLATNLGFAVGPLLAGLLYENHTRWLFIGDAGTTIVSMLILALFLPETLPARGKVNNEEVPDAEKPLRGSAMAILFRRPMLLSFVLLMIIPWFVYSQHSFALPMFAKELYPEGGALLFGKVMSLSAVIVVLFTVPLIRATRSLKPVTNVAIHSLLYALGFGMLALFRSPAAFYVSVFIWTSGEILGATNIDVHIANHTPSSHRGRFGSILPLISSTGRAVSPWLTGLYLLTRPIGSIWKLSFVLGALAAGCFLLLGIAETLHRRS